MAATPNRTLWSAADRRRLRSHLLRWYDRHKRDLPWRADSDPYRVWLSEMMLQQTRVAAVVEHYQAFLKRFPTLERLAAAREASVLAAWSGLGYYRRARMLHAAAKRIVAQHQGRFPANALQLRALPGIGRYTAAAVASIAFGEVVAVVDGNVERVLERLLGRRMAGESRWQAAGEVLSRGRPGDFNQAMMELGATTCLPRQPLCPSCPVRGLCATRGAFEKPSKPARQNRREIHYALDCRKGSVFLVRRASDASLMPGMWELPEIRQGSGGEAWLSLRHSITMTDYVVWVMRASAPTGTAGVWVDRRRATNLPLTGLAKKILRAARWE
jgi:A/G-specific adenine glycosylase